MKKVFIVLLAIVLLFPLCVYSPAAAAEKNAAPSVIPAVREWTGSVGTFVITQNTRIALSDSSLVAEKYQTIIDEYFEEILGFALEYTTDPPSAGDIYLFDANDSSLGSEGYTIECKSILKLCANSGVGFLYGFITVLQSIVADGYFPNGYVRDYPQYSVRSGMIDVARMYIPLEYVEEITKYFAWFKLNEIHLHISDIGANGYTAFRLESSIEGLTSTDGYYTKDEYRAYQKRMLDYNVSVITEIDTPSHSGCFSEVAPELMLDENNLDITNSDTITFVENLFKEYISGKDPVFVSKKVHFGTDSYSTEYSEEMRKYINTLIQFFNSYKYTPRFWGSFGGDGYNGTTKVSGKAQVNYWAVGLSDAETLLSMGYSIINTCAPVLYSIPGGSSGFSDYLDVETYYETWYVNYLGVNSESAVTSKKILGACFAVWNDVSYTDGYSIFDVFDRIRCSACFVAEKTWTGDGTADHTVEDYLTRYEKVSLRTGGSNPARYATLPISSESDTEFTAVRSPYLLEWNGIWHGSNTTECFFSGEEGAVQVAADGTLQLLQSYYFNDGTKTPCQDLLYSFDFQLQQNREYDLKLYCADGSVTLVVDDQYVYRLQPETVNQQISFVLPFEKVGSENVEVANWSITENHEDLNTWLLNSNYALHKTVETSLDDSSAGLSDATSVTDGDKTTVLKFTDDKNSQWMLVDLGEEYSVNKIVIRFQKHAPAYTVVVSSDGVDFQQVYSSSGGTSGEEMTDTIEIPLENIRYIRFFQDELIYDSDTDSYSGCAISEFEVYGMDTSSYQSLINQALAYENDERVADAIRNLRTYLKAEEVYACQVNAYYQTLADLVEELKEDDSQDESAESEETASAEESSLESETTGNSQEITSSVAEEQKGKLGWIAGIATCVLLIGLLVFVINLHKKIPGKKEH